MAVKVGGNSGSSSITFLPLLACILLFGPIPAVIFHAATGVFGEVLVRRNEPIKATFNISQYLLSTIVGGLVFQWLGGVGQAMSGTALEVQGVELVGFGIAFLAINNGAVSVGITILEDMPFAKAWGLLVGRSGTNLLYDLLISPFSILMAVFYMDYKIAGFLLVIFPLLLIRMAYYRNSQLQEASANLLKALVKAIDVRDPYTSGHSQRVSMLSRRIAEYSGLSTAQAKQVETAALLHDIGKIDKIFLEILRKKGPLTVLERRMIESHVTLGVELLESLSSYPEAVLGAVRHHHERVDGGGYPDGLAGNEIPIGARIIKVADAVDAVLSSSVLSDHADEILVSGLNVAETIHGSAARSAYPIRPRVLRRTVLRHLELRRETLAVFALSLSIGICIQILFHSEGLSWGLRTLDPGCGASRGVYRGGTPSRRKRFW